MKFYFAFSLLQVVICMHQRNTFCQVEWRELEWRKALTNHQAEIRINFPDACTEHSNKPWHMPSSLSIFGIQNAVILPETGLVLNSTKAYTFGKWYWERQAEWEQNVTHTPKALVGPRISLLEIWIDSFSHIVFNSLPKISLICSMLQHDDHLRVLVVNSIQKHLIALVCPESAGRSDVITKPLSSSLIFVPFYTPADLKMGLSIPNSLSPLGKYSSANCVGGIGTVLYLTRKEKKRRPVVNEEDVVESIKSVFGEGRVEILQTSTWETDAPKFANARVIIGPHGGALANMVFAGKGAVVVEFISSNGIQERPCYFGLARALNFSYMHVEPKAFDFYGPMEIQTNKLISVMEHAKKLAEQNC
eukprot:m.339678 g.339678  ORF g.339678 m.339678 type:complete len:362 (+) comp18909_c0_seq1:498-1583(+)